jgi:hypothetical protein
LDHCWSNSLGFLHLMALSQSATNSSVIHPFSYTCLMMPRRNFSLGIVCLLIITYSEIPELEYCCLLRF